MSKWQTKYIQIQISENESSRFLNRRSKYWTPRRKGLNLEKCSQVTITSIYMFSLCVDAEEKLRHITRACQSFLHHNSHSDCLSYRVLDKDGKEQIRI